MNEAAMKAFGYTERDEAFVRGERALWIAMGMDGKVVEGGTSLMPVEAVVEDYYTGHLTAGKKPLVFMVSPSGGGSQYQIACKHGKEKELISYLKKVRQEILTVTGWKKMCRHCIAKIGVCQLSSRFSLPSPSLFRLWVCLASLCSISANATVR